jgi:cysteine-rich repeat protein
LPICGNAIIEFPEPCDDGNLVNGDGCDNNCTLTGCGNGIVTAAEACDDGNFVDGDGCSSACEREFLNPIPAAGDHFGQAIAVLGANLIVGAPLHDSTDAINSGIAYLLSGTTGAVLRTFEDPVPDPGDEFGFAVAGVGPWVVVGAPFDGTAGPQAGAVYVFDGATGGLVRTLLNPTPGRNDRFGWALAAAGTDILIGAPQDDTGAGSGGAVYRYNGATGALNQVYLNSSPHPGDQFGFAVAALGASVIVGAPGRDAAGSVVPPLLDIGAAYLFNGSTAVLMRTFVSPNQNTEDGFGWSVAAVGTAVLVGAPFDHAGSAKSGAAYLFNGSTGALLSTLMKATRVANDDYGFKVAALGTDKMLVGARRDDGGALNAGAVYLYRAPNGELLATFQKGIPGGDEDFGRTIVAVDTMKFFVGAPMDNSVEIEAGAVYAFRDRSCGNGTLNPGEICDDGNQLDGDGCDLNCTLTACGNGIVTAGEQCDDGNTVSGDGCSATCQREGVCGNAVLEPREQCDDGNLVDGDGCDHNCTLTGCGNGIVTTGEQCDNGPANGIDLCCSATCQLMDTDVDGICDQDDVCPSVADPAQLNTDGDAFGNACDLCPGDADNDSDGDGFCFGAPFNAPAAGGDDPCTPRSNAAPWVKPVVLFNRLDPPHNDDKLRIKGQFKINNRVPALDLVTYGMHIRITDRAKLLIVDEHIPGSVFDIHTQRGWRGAGGNPPTKWIYLDKNKPPLQNGIRKILVQDFSSFGKTGQIGVVIQGKQGDYRLSQGQEPLSVSIALNDHALPEGSTPGRDQCGEVTFTNSTSAPHCEFKGASVLRCK